MTTWATRLELIEQRVRSSICDTYSSDGAMRREGRISEGDFADLLKLLEETRAADQERCGAGYPADLRDARQALAAERARADKAERERDDEAAYAKCLQIALTGLAGGGSENFVRHGDGFRADIAACCERINQRQTGFLKSLIGFAKRARNAEAALSSANARIRELEAQRGGAAETALRSIVHKLSRINDRVEDEGDRVYLGSTNDRERLQECADAVWLWWLANLTDEAADPAPARAEQDGEGRS